MTGLILVALLILPFWMLWAMIDPMPLIRHYRKKRAARRARD